MAAKQYSRKRLNTRQHGKVWLVGCALLCSGGAMAADLVTVFRMARDNDATLRSARAQLEADREKYPQARASLLPAITFAYQKQDQSSTFTSLGPPSQTSSADTRPTAKILNLTQPLFRWQAFETFEQSKLLVSKAELDYANAEQELALKVAQAYFDILASQDSIGVLVKQKAAISEQLAAAKRNFEVGTATITDQQEAQARYDLVLAQEIAANNDLEIKRAALQNLVGGPAPELAPLQTSIRLPALSPADSGQWVKSATDNNLGVQSVRILTEVAKREVSKARGGHLPTVDLVATRTQNDGIRFGPTTSNSDVRSVGIQVNVPLFAGLGTQARVRETQFLEDKLKSDLDAAQRNAAQVARQTYAGVQSGLAQVSALQAAEKSSQLALESNKLGYQVGVRINIDVLNAQQQLSSTQRDLSRAKYDTLVNGLRLKASAGSLRESDLLDVSGLLEGSAAKP
jgi:outer membrane protein